ncbi:acetyl-CoA synthetase-like protein [Coniophora puteana RWD-64-598 SS2]|uniref:Acetyl-CoA synthetase-like protein n=1 Tax=Coniophora puteana (strain RWD-64-598) TaxID=741705 RepID=A0A5M3N5P1_CONPW|nr:acetyl-CoA synthetase-like protein [Coniophora puteana RWD-64-598 SS2]EIW86577.1 acetyl-CoA synthetase-like protein [Coniophora puteana RWD-64-598 SS2]
MHSLSPFQPTAASLPPKGATYLQKQVQGISVNHHALNPLSFILRAATVYPDRIALLHPDVKYPVQYTFRVWAQRIQNLAYALIEAGINPGDRVAVIAPNCPMIADAHHGVLGARAIFTPINTRLTPPEVAYILEHSGAKLILVDQECTHLIRGTTIPTIVSNDTGRDDDPYEAFLASGRRFSRERGWMGLDVERDEDAGAVLNYTSGTTGKPKGVLTTLRGSYLAAVGNVVEGQMNKESTYLWILPMFHAAGWTYPWANVFACAKQVTIRSVDYNAIWRHFLHSRVTHYCAAPTVQIGIVNHPDARPLPQPVTAIIAGAAPTAQLIGQLEQQGIKPVHVYGLTQTYGPFTRCYDQDSWSSLSLEDRAKLMARQGQSFATAQEVRVVYPPRHDNDQELIDVPRDGNTVGEIVTRGNIVMKEYFRDPDATKKAFRGGYFNSGDLAVMYPDGVVAIMDRSKDLIISGGENASSLAIEQELAAHPDVLEVSVVARAHEKWGERPMAFAILHPERSSKWEGNHDAFVADLKKHARTRLPGFATPEWVEVVQELPKTSTGKILKTALRKRVAKL